MISLVLGFAICHPCRTQLAWPIFKQVILHYWDLQDRRDWSSHRGVVFYTPDAHHQKRLAVYLEDPPCIPDARPSDGPQLIDALLGDV